MAKLRLWQFLALIFSFIVSSKCCMLSRGMGVECHLRRASFGGRLVFMGNNGVRSGNFPALPSRGRVLIFQTPPAHLRSHMGFGRGQIWIGRRTCQGSNSQVPGHCPWTAGDRPCLDTKLPCNTGQGCASFPCENDGRCIPGADGVSFTCECISGFTGLHCENAPAQTPCNPNPCMNGGVCNLVGWNSFSCSCPTAFIGTRCEQEQTACNPNPCQNGGTCSLQGISGFSCTCIGGFTGVTCGEVHTACNPNPCMNGGVCNLVGWNSFSCSCPTAFIGTRCEQGQTACNPNPCQNGGACSLQGINGFSCTCIGGFTGVTCGQECHLRGASFGGRLVFMGNNGVRSGNFPALSSRGRVLIFQTPPVHLRSHMGFGRGQIWIGRRTCQGSNSQVPGHCPWTAGDRPCLDTKLPCHTEAPSYAQSNPLEFPEVSENSIKVSWPAWNEITDLGLGPITGYKILYRQLDEIFQEIFLDRDRSYHWFDGLTSGTTYEFRVVLVREGIPSEGPPSNIQNVTTRCRELEHVDLRVETMPMPGLNKSSFNVSWLLPSLTGNCDISHQSITLHRLDVANCLSTPGTKPKFHSLHTGIRSDIFDRLRPYSLFNITYLARNPAGTYVKSQLNRTAETIPIEAPQNLTHQTIGNKVVLNWKEPPCRSRNGEIKKYNCQIILNGDSSYHRIERGTSKEHTIRQVFSGDEWVFRVKACTRVGCGPTAETSGTRT